MAAVLESCYVIINGDVISSLIVMNVISQGSVIRVIRNHTIMLINIHAGCINDVQNVRRFLTQRFGFTDDRDHMVILTDDQKDYNFQPTKQNILNAMRWLVGGARPGDSLVFHYSGHGGQVFDRGTYSI